MHKKIFAYLLGFFIFFTLYNTLIPFEFDVPFSELGGQLQKINRIPFFDADGDLVSLTDIVGNIFLFIPFGFLCYMLLWYMKKRHRLVWCILGGAALSFTIEFLQLFIYSRDTAIHDLVNNTLGSAIGATVAAIYATQLSEFISKTFFDLLKNKPALLIVILLLLAQSVSAIMPFTVSISVSGFVKSVKETNLVPFTYRPLSVLLFDDYSKDAQFQMTDSVKAKLQQSDLPADVVENLRKFDQPEPQSRRKFLDAIKSVVGGKALKAHRETILQLAQIRSEETIFDFTQMIENIIFWAIAGYLISLSLLLYFPQLPRANLIRWLFPVIYFILLEFAQIFITSRITDINDIIGGCAGVYAGYLLFRLLPPTIAANRQLDVSMLKIPVLLYAIFILFSGFRPFDWSMNPAVWGKDFEQGNLIPFYAYFRKTNLWNLYDLVRTLAFFAPLSLYFSYKLRLQQKSFPGIFILMTLAGLLTGALIEFTQILSPSRVAEITDVISYGISGALGVFAMYYYEQEVRPKFAAGDVSAEQG